MTFTPAGAGEPITRKVYEFPGGGVAMGMYNLDESIRDLFQEVYDNELAAEFKKHNLTYEHRLIDDMVALVLKWNGGFRLGLEELRWRRAVGHPGVRLWLSRHDDFSAADP
jgi:isocitrate dehydrogenase